MGIYEKRGIKEKLRETLTERASGLELVIYAGYRGNFRGPNLDADRVMKGIDETLVVFGKNPYGIRLNGKKGGELLFIPMGDDFWLRGSFFPSGRESFSVGAGSLKRVLREIGL